LSRITIDPWQRSPVIRGIFQPENPGNAPFSRRDRGQEWKPRGKVTTIILAEIQTAIDRPRQRLNSSDGRHLSLGQPASVSAPKATPFTETLPLATTYFTGVSEEFGILESSPQMS